MRVVSLVPAASDWLVAFGAQGVLVGRSHRCDAPAVQALPALTRPDGRGGWTLEAGALHALRPDLVVTPPPGGLGAAALGALFTGAAPPRRFAFAPTTFKEVLDRALALGHAVGRLPEAMSALAEGERRLVHLRERLGLTRQDRDGDALPRVACLADLDPLTVPGLWVPDLVAHAGGRAVLAEPGEPDRAVDWSTLLDADPDVVALALRARPEAAAQNLRRVVAARTAGHALRAVREGRVFAFDGLHLFNRPGPRLIASAEALAAALHPARSAEPGG